MKIACTEDTAQNTELLIDEQYQFAQSCWRKEDDQKTHHQLYWDVTYFETCIVTHRVQAKVGKPAVVPKGHRGTYIPMDERVKKQKSKNPPTFNPEALMQIALMDDKPVEYSGAKVNSLALCTATTGIEVLMARSLFWHFTKQDLLEKIEAKYPGKAFTFNLQRGNAIVS